MRARSDTPEVTEGFTEGEFLVAAPNADNDSTPISVEQQKRESNGPAGPSNSRLMMTYVSVLTPQK
jgi:hypothetical protein